MLTGMDLILTLLLPNLVMYILYIHTLKSLFVRSKMTISVFNYNYVVVEQNSIPPQ